MIAEIARTWIGTPYRHQSAVKGEGCDCLGLLRGVWAEYYGAHDYSPLPNYSPRWGEHLKKEDLWIQVGAQHFTLLHATPSVLSPGQVLFFRMSRNMAVKHCAIVGTPETMIHAYSGHVVREEAITDRWRKKIAAVFEWPPLH